MLSEITLQRRLRGFAHMNRTVIEHHDNGLGLGARFGAVEPVEFFQKSDEIGAALGGRGSHGQLAAGPGKRAHHGNLFRLSRGRDAQIRAAFCLNPRQIGMRQRFALIGVKQHDIAGFGLLTAKLQPQANAIDSPSHLAALSGCAAPRSSMPKESSKPPRSWSMQVECWSRTERHAATLFRGAPRYSRRAGFDDCVPHSHRSLPYAEEVGLGRR